VKKALQLILVALVFSTSVPAKAQIGSPIQVLIARTQNVSEQHALSMLAQINQLMDKSGLANRQFEVAGSAPNYVAPTLCPGRNHSALLACAKVELEEERNLKNADIVIMLTAALDPIIGTLDPICGAVPTGMINNPLIIRANHGLGYAVVANNCMQATGLFPASHEVLHLLYIEHKGGDPFPEFPALAEDNHAATSQVYATAGAVPTDCNPDWTCSNFKNKMSAAGEFFQSNSSFPSGNSSDSNAKNVLTTKFSWDVVAAYRPIPPPPEDCNLKIEVQCLGGQVSNPLVTAFLPGYTVTSADYDVSFSGGPWNNIFSGLLTCVSFSNNGVTATVRATLQTLSGISQCTIPVPLPNCEGFNPW
jgi:hypothetical protein